MGYDNEKGDIEVVHTDEASGKGSDKAIKPHPNEWGFSDKEQKSIIHRIDRRLVVTVGVLYCVSLMDRTNLAAAIIAGMAEDLMMIGNNRYVSLSRRI